MSKQRFLGGLLGANPLRDGSFTDPALTGSVENAETFFINGETGDFTITGNDIAHNTANVADVIYADTTGYTGKYYYEVYLYGGFARAGFLKSSVTDTNIFLGNNAGAFAFNANGAAYSLLEEGTTTQIGTGTLDGSQSHAVYGVAVDFDNDEVTICWTDVYIDGTRYWVDGSYSTSTSFPASATITTAGVTDRIAVGHYHNTTYPEAYFNFGDDPTFGGNLPGTPTADSSSWYRDPPAGYDAKLGITVGSTDRTTSNVGVVALDEAGPETVDAYITTVQSNTFGTDDAAEEVTYYNTNLAGANDLGCLWGPGGTTFYWNAGAVLNQVDCSTPYDLTTAGTPETTTMSGGVNPSYKFSFNDDGTQIMYSSNSTTHLRYRPLSTAYDITTVGSETAIANVGYYLQAHLGDNGNLYLVSRDATTAGDGDVRTFSDPSDFSSSLTNQKQLDSGVQYNQTGDPFMSAFNDDGTVMWLAATGDYAGIEELHLSTPYDPTSVTKANNITVAIDTDWTASSGASEIKSLQYAGGSLWVMANNSGRKLYKFPISEEVASTETRELTQMFWGGIRGRDAIPADTSLANTGILSLSELLQASYGVEASASIDVLVVGAGSARTLLLSSQHYASGGNGGSIVRRTSFDVSAGASYAITVGTGATSINGNSGASESVGADGGATTFGVLTAAGGVAQQANHDAHSYAAKTTADIDETVTSYSAAAGAGSFAAASGSGAGGSATSGAASTATAGAAYVYQVNGTTVNADISGGTNWNTSATAASTVTGGTPFGHGGEGGYNVACPGGDGVVYVAYPTGTVSSYTWSGSAGDINVDTATVSGYTILRFTGDGNWTPTAT